MRLAFWSDRQHAARPTAGSATSIEMCDHGHLRGGALKLEAWEPIRSLYDIGQNNTPSTVLVFRIRRGNDERSILILEDGVRILAWKLIVLDALLTSEVGVLV